VSPAVARVLPDLPAVDRVFDYDATDGIAVRVGDRVRVALHGRSVRGWVVGLADRTEHGRLRPVAKSLGLGPPPTVVALTEWGAWRWAGPWSRLLATASPDRVVTELPAVPAATALPDVHNQLRVFALRLARTGAATLVRTGPCTDPMDLVLALLHANESTGADGTLVVTTPTLGWADRFATRLRRRGVAAAGPDRWAEARAGFPVVVGARAGALAPVPRLAGAVVLDAHDDAYRQTQTPCWSAVGLLAERCRREQAPLVATSWCPDPSLTALFAATEPLEPESRSWPRLVVADLSATDPRERLLTSELAAQAHRALDEGRDGVRVAVILQRLGGARLLACRVCGALAVCESHGLALRDGEGGLCCDRGCTAHPRLCVRCGAPALRAIGLAGRLVGARGSTAPGHVLVQTRQPDHLAVRAAVRGDPSALVAEEAEVAAALSLPPHVAVCTLSGEGAAALGATLAARGVQVTADRDRLLCVAPTHRELCDALAVAPRPKAPVRVEVDPGGL